MNIITPTNAGIGKNDLISNDPHHPPRNQSQITHVQYPVFKPIGQVQEPSSSGIHSIKNTGNAISKPLYMKQSNVSHGSFYPNNYKYNNNSTIGNQMNKYQPTTPNVRSGNDSSHFKRAQDNLNKTNFGGGASINRTNIKH